MGRAPRQSGKFKGRRKGAYLKGFRESQKHAGDSTVTVRRLSPEEIAREFPRR